MPGDRTGSYRLSSLEKPEEERARLKAQAELLLKDEIAFISSAGAIPGARVLDIGCGGGEITRRIADVVGPRGFVIGIDRDAGILPANSDRPNLRFLQGSADRLDPTIGAFDLIYARFVAQHLPDPLAMIRNAATFLKPRGAIALIDSDDRLLCVDPPDEELSGLLARAEEAQGAAGGDRRVGLKLTRLLAEAGLRPETFRVKMLTSREMPFSLLFGLATGYKAALIGESARFRQVGERLAGQLELNGGVFVTGVCAAVGRLPAE